MLKKILSLTLASLLFVSYQPINLYAMFEEEGVEDILFAEIPVVTIAALVEEKPEKASSNVSVITAEDINLMSPRDLMDIYDMIPGFDPSVFITGGQSAAIRGLLTTSMPQFKIMVDGVHINNIDKGSTIWLTPGLQLDNIKQIEIIRGPGSALYGENALSGAMNIITKGANDVDGLQITGRAGSFKNKGGSFLLGEKLNKVDIFASFDYHDTDGAKEKIERDMLFGTPFTLAPGKTSYDKERYQGILKLSTKTLYFKVSYEKLTMAPIVGGVNYAITNDNTLETDLLTTSFHYTYGGVSCKSKTYINYIDEHSSGDLAIFPPGYTIPFDLDGDGDIETFPNGARGQPGYKNSRLSIGNNFTFTGLTKNLILLGVSYEYARQYDATSKTNFHPITGAQASDGISQVDFTDTLNWTKNEDRSIWSVFAQDKIELLDNLSVTAGGRYDNYKDIESQFNPRVSIVWSLNDKLDIKGMAGSAFRVPNYNEMYARNNPSNIGDENLKSEKIKSYEMGGYLKLDDKSSYINTNFYHNQITNVITIAFNSGLGLNQYSNSDSKQTFFGMENELNMRLTDWAKGNLSYSYTYGEDSKTDLKISGISHHKITAGVNFIYQDYLTFNVTSLYYSKKERARGDTRDDVDAYNLVNTTLNFIKIQDMQFSLSVHNLFDKSYFSPEPVGLVYYDLPRPGRDITFKATVKF